MIPIKEPGVVMQSIGRQAPVTGRSFERQRDLLNLGDYDFRGKRVLTLGPGYDFAFEKGAVERGASEVVTVGCFDHDESAPHECRVALRKEFPSIRSVDDFFHTYPVEPNFYDLIASAFGFPMYGFDVLYSTQGHRHHAIVAGTMSRFVTGLRSRGKMVFFPTPTYTGQYLRRIVDAAHGSQVYVQRRKVHRFDADAILTIGRKD